MFSEVMERFYTMMVSLFTWVYVSGKNLQIIHLTCMQHINGHKLRFTEMNSAKLFKT